MDYRRANGIVLAERFLQNWQERPPKASSPLYLGACTTLAVGYGIAAKLGLELAFLNASATPVWPPTAIAAVAFLMLGNRVWPAIFIGAFCVNLTTAGSVLTSLGIAIGNTMEGIAGAYLIRKFAGGLNVFTRPQYIFRFALLAVVLAPMVSATIGVTTLSLGGLAPWPNYRLIWITWWLGDAAGMAVFGPLLVLSFASPLPRWDLRNSLEAFVLTLCLIFAGLVVFGEMLGAGVRNYPLEFLCIPFLLWAAFRFGELAAAVAVVILSLMAIWGTLHHFGPFVRNTPNESLLLLQGFMSVIGVMSVAVAAVVSERKGVEDALRKARDELEQTAATDPLTGLGNYRRLEDVLSAEARRSQRTGRSFALLLLDLNGLKKINDAHGHLIGSRALCRVANILHLYCRRSIDTAARHGGDEFALLMPETGFEGAAHVAEQIAEAILNDGEEPPISVSFGIALYPEHSETVEGVFQKADAALYVMKEGVGR